MSHLPLLTTPRVACLGPTTPTTPPQTTDDESESSDNNETVEMSSELKNDAATFPPSCQLTPPTPPLSLPSNINSNGSRLATSTKTIISSPIKQGYDAPVAPVAPVGRKRRQKQATVSSTSADAKTNQNQENDTKLLEIKALVANSSNTEDAGGDYCPARKTRRKSLRIRDISKQVEQESCSGGKCEASNKVVDETTDSKTCQTKNISKNLGEAKQLNQSTSNAAHKDLKLTRDTWKYENNDNYNFHKSISTISTISIERKEQNSVECMDFESCKSKKESTATTEGPCSSLLLLSNVASNVCQAAQNNNNNNNNIQQNKANNRDDKSVGGATNDSCKTTKEVDTVDGTRSSSLSGKNELQQVDISCKSNITSSNTQKKIDSNSNNSNNSNFVNNTCERTNNSNMQGKNCRIESNVVSRDNFVLSNKPLNHYVGKNIPGQPVNMESSKERRQGDLVHCFSDIQPQFQLRSIAAQQTRLPNPSPSKPDVPLPLAPIISCRGQRQLQITTPHNHQLQLQQDDETHVCVECNKVFKRSIYLQRHMAREHWTTAKLFKCDTCSYETKHQSNLLVHKRTHTGERPYYCGECGQRYTQGHLLKAHIRSRHFSNMQLYNMEKRSPSEILVQTSSNASDPNEVVKQRASNDYKKKTAAVSSLRISDGCETTTTSRPSNEEFSRSNDKMKYLIEAATSFHGQNQFLHKNIDLNPTRPLLQSSVCRSEDQSMPRVKLENDCKIFQETSVEDREVSNYAVNRSQGFFHQNLLKVNHLMPANKEAEYFTPGKMGSRRVCYNNGEVIDLDTPEPAADLNGDSSASTPYQNGVLKNMEVIRNKTPPEHSEQSKMGPNRFVHSNTPKQSPEKFLSVPAPSLFPYLPLINDSQSLDCLNGFPTLNNGFPPPPQPPLYSSSVLYNSFLGSTLLNPLPCPHRQSPIYTSEVRMVETPLCCPPSLHNVHLQTVDVSSGSENDEEDQFVDVDGDDEEDMMPLNLTTPKSENLVNAEIRGALESDLPCDLSKRNSPQVESVQTSSSADDCSPHQSAFKSCYKTFFQPNNQSVIKPDNSQNSPDHLDKSSKNCSNYEDQRKKDAASESVHNDLPCCSFNIDNFLDKCIKCCGISPTTTTTTTTYDRCSPPPSEASNKLSDDTSASNSETQEVPISVASTTADTTTGSTDSPSTVKNIVNNDSISNMRNTYNQFLSTYTGLNFPVVSSLLCQASSCPDRLKLESLRRDVYRMLKVFMPYLGLDDMEDCKTDALDNFLHEVLYSKLDG